jgi:hypothetical protein
MIGCPAIELVVSCGDAPPIFDTTEKIFDLMALAIEALGTVGFPARVAKVVDLIR